MDHLLVEQTNFYCTPHQIHAGNKIMAKKLTFPTKIDNTLYTYSLHFHVIFSRDVFISNMYLLGRVRRNSSVSLTTTTATKCFEDVYVHFPLCERLSSSMHFGMASRLEVPPNSFS